MIEPFTLKHLAMGGPSYPWHKVKKEAVVRECIDNPAECRGVVEMRPSLTGTGTAIPRCDGHWEQRLEREEELRNDYPDSPIAPSWFDPTVAGERWDDDY